MTDAQGRRGLVAVDNPIRNSEDDTLGRTEQARSFVEHVLSLDVTEGVVVGVLGPWGSGKTSFLNLARPCFKEDEDIVILDFNPWMFSGTEQLIQSFFAELSAQLKLHRDLSGVSKNLEKYGEIVSEVLYGMPCISWLSPVIKVLLKFFQGKPEGIRGRRAKLEEALRAYDKPVVVVLDDIDRLTTAEIKDIFKLVRLIANFPNIIYVVAFDRVRVEGALTEQNIPGRDYLEKIMQVGIDLPAAPTHVLSAQAERTIEHVLTTINHDDAFDDDRWPDVFIEVVRPLLRNMRDVRRYAAVIHGTVQELNGQIALVDILALEAVRVFLPDVFCQMHGSVDALTNSSRSPSQVKFPSQINRLLDAAGNQADVVKGLIERLFPVGIPYVDGLSTEFSDALDPNRWLRERRVAHEDILRLYLERVAGEGLQMFTDAEQAWARMADRQAFDQYLHSLNPEHLPNVISSLEAYQDHFASSHVRPATVVLLNILPELPKQPRGMFDMAPQTIVMRVVRQLLRSLPDSDAVETEVRKILPDVASLSSRIELITWVGYQDKIEHQLVSKSAANKFEKDWYAEVRSASAQALAKEKELLWILLYMKKEADPLPIPDLPQVTLALLQSARTLVDSQSFGSRAVHRDSRRLAWDPLVEVYGDEGILRERIKQLKASPPKGMDDELVQLAEKYLSGWRPSLDTEGPLEKEGISSERQSIRRK